MKCEIISDPKDFAKVPTTATWEKEMRARCSGSRFPSSMSDVKEINGLRNPLRAALGLSGSGQESLGDAKIHKCPLSLCCSHQGFIFRDAFTSWEEKQERASTGI